ncbi:MAG: tetratricopeptide repeat protein [bacterium]|nr:tetratricopeptide repeat protein [bacterium]
MSFNFFKEEGVDVVEASTVMAMEEEVGIIGGDHEANMGEADGFNFRKISKWLIYALVFLLPLFVLPITSDVLGNNKQLLLVVLGGAAAIFYLLDVIKTGIFVYKPSSFYLPVSVFVGLVLVSSLFSVNRYISFLGGVSNAATSFISVALMAVVLFVAFNVIEDRGEKIKNIFASSLSLTLLLGVLQAIGVNVFGFLGSVGRNFNTIGSSFNSLGMLAAVALPLFMVPTGDMKPVWKKIYDVLKLAGLVLGVFVLILVNWWPVWLVAFISLMFWMMFKVFEARKIKMSIFAWPLAIVVIGTFLILIKFNLPLKSSLPLEVSVSNSASVSIAKSSLNERLIFGYGAGNFGVAYDKFRPADIAQTAFADVRFSKASSEALTAVSEGGLLAIVGFLFFAWFLGQELYRRFRGISSGGSTSSSTVPMVVGFLVLLFLYPLNLSLMFTGVVALMLFALSSSGAEEKRVSLESSPILSLVGSVMFIVALVGVLAGGYFVVNKYIANMNYARAQAESDSDKKIELLVKAINSDPNQSLYSRELSVVVVQRLANELGRQVPREKQQEQANIIQNNIVSSVDIANRATTVDPMDARNWANRGFVYQNLMGLVGGAENVAIDMYKESLKRNPNDPTTYTRIANTYLAIADNFSRTLDKTSRSQISVVNDLRSKISANLEQAANYYQESIKLNNNNGRSLYNLAAVYERQGNLPQAIAQLDKLRVSNPSDPSLVFTLGLLYYRNNQKNEAFNSWQQAVNLFPDYSNARWYLSLVYEERGDLDNALAQVVEIDKLNPNNTLVLQRITQLEAGKRIIPPGNVLDQQPLGQ